VTLIVLAALAAAACVALFVALTRRQPRAAATAPPAPRREPDFFDGAFSLANVARRIREEAALAGRAAAEGRPLAARLEDLPSRRWVEERIEERIAELRRDLVVALAEIEGEEHRLTREAEDGKPRVHALRARVNQLTELHRAETSKPRTDQDFGVEGRLDAARAELRLAEEHLRAAELRRDELIVRRDRLPAQTEAEIAYLRDACDTLVLEHDMAYEAAEHRHPDKEPLSGPPATPAPVAVIPLAAITEGARREGAIAGRAAVHGTGPAAVDGLASRRWITERFGEHIAAVKAQSASERRVVGEELAVIAEQIREAERAIARGAQLHATLLEARAKADAAGDLAGHEREIQLAERNLQTAQGRLHEHELLRERLAERQRRGDADYEARVEFLKEALAAAIAEHDLAFDTAARSMTASRNGSGPAPFTPTDR
jgi:hypothetical protein